MSLTRHTIVNCAKGRCVHPARYDGQTISVQRAAGTAWPVTGPALQIGLGSLGDENWINDTRTRLRCDAVRLDALLSRQRFHPEGRTELFRLHRVPNAAAIHESLARHRNLVRTCGHSSTRIRFGLPGTEEEWARLEGAVGCLN